MMRVTAASLANIIVKEVSFFLYAIQNQSICISDFNVMIHSDVFLYLASFI